MKVSSKLKKTIGDTIKIGELTYTIVNVTPKNGFYEYEITEIGTIDDNPKIKKEILLDNIIVTVSTGHRFYADQKSRVDLQNAIALQDMWKGNTIPWKTPDGWIQATLEELKEAIALGLKEKEKIIREFA